MAESSSLPSFAWGRPQAAVGNTRHLAGNEPVLASKETAVSLISKRTFQDTLQNLDASVLRSLPLSDGGAFSGPAAETRDGQSRAAAEPTQVSSEPETLSNQNAPEVVHSDEGKLKDGLVLHTPKSFADVPAMKPNHMLSGSVHEPRAKLEMRLETLDPVTRPADPQSVQKPDTLRSRAVVSHAPALSKDSSPGLNQLPEVEISHTQKERAHLPLVSATPVVASAPPLTGRDGKPFEPKTLVHDQPKVQDGFATGAESRPFHNRVDPVVIAARTKPDGPDILLKSIVTPTTTTPPSPVTPAHRTSQSPGFGTVLPTTEQSPTASAQITVVAPAAPTVVARESSSVSETNTTGPVNHAQSHGLRGNEIVTRPAIQTASHVTEPVFEGTLSMTKEKIPIDVSTLKSAKDIPQIVTSHVPHLEQRPLQAIGFPKPPAIETRQQVVTSGVVTADPSRTLDRFSAQRIPTLENAPISLSDKDGQILASRTLNLETKQLETGDTSRELPGFLKHDRSSGEAAPGIRLANPPDV
jgi:hypothetical protein